MTKVIEVSVSRDARGEESIISQYGKRTVLNLTPSYNGEPLLARIVDVEWDEEKIYFKVEVPESFQPPESFFGWWIRLVPDAAPLTRCIAFTN